MEIQYVTSESGEPTAVIVPIALWREMAAEREAAYLLSSETIKQRLPAAKGSTNLIPFEEAIEKHDA